MLKTANEADVNRAILYCILSGETDPRAGASGKIANVRGYRLTLVKQT